MCTYTYISIYVCMCMCYDARCLWSGCSSCVARVTSSTAMLVGMWWVWLRPAHKTLHPGTVLLPLQTGKLRPMGKPHRRPASGASLYCCFFFSPTHAAAQLTRGSGPLASGRCGVLCLWPVSLHLNEKNGVIMKAAFAHITWSNHSECYNWFYAGAVGFCNTLVATKVYCNKRV